MPVTPHLSFAAFGLGFAVLILLVRRGLLSPRQFSLAAAVVFFGAAVGAAFSGGEHV